MAGTKKRASARLGAAAKTTLTSKDNPPPAKTKAALSFVKPSKPGSRKAADTQEVEAIASNEPEEVKVSQKRPRGSHSPDQGSIPKSRKTSTVVTGKPSKAAIKAATRKVPPTKEKAVKIKTVAPEPELDSEEELQQIRMKRLQAIRRPPKPPAIPWDDASDNDQQSPSKATQLSSQVVKVSAPKTQAHSESMDRKANKQRNTSVGSDYEGQNQSDDGEGLQASDVDENFDDSEDLMATVWTGDEKSKVTSSRKAVATAASEKPTWFTPPSSDNDDEALVVNNQSRVAPTPFNVDGSDSDIQLVSPNDGWPVITHLVYTSYPIQLQGQNRSIRDVFTAALQNVQGDLFFVDAFPDGPTRTKFNRDAIYKAAIGLNEKEIAERASKDVWFVTHLSNVLAPRISILRSDIRKIAVAGIAGAFTLTTAEDIAELLKLDSYIYPREANKIQNHRPYRHSLIQYIIKIKMFTGRLPFYVYHRDRFAKTSAAGIVTQHVPAAMIAMAATALYSVIKDWGKSKQQEFNADAYTDVYLRHMASLRMIEMKAPAAYHALTASIYNSCVTPGVASSSSPIADMNFEGMSVVVD